MSDPWIKIRPKRSSNLLNRLQHSRLGPAKHANSRKSCVLSTVIWLESPRVLNIALEIPAILIRKGFPLCQMIIHFSQWQAQVLNPWHGMKVYKSDSWEASRHREGISKRFWSTRQGTFLPTSPQKHQNLAQFRDGETEIQDVGGAWRSGIWISSRTPPPSFGIHRVNSISPQALRCFAIFQKLRFPGWTVNNSPTQVSISIRKRKGTLTKQKIWTNRTRPSKKSQKQKLGGSTTSDFEQNKCFSDNTNYFIGLHSEEDMSRWKPSSPSKEASPDDSAPTVLRWLPYQLHL